MTIDESNYDDKPLDLKKTLDEVEKLLYSDEKISSP